jgi:hypothetical protein
MPVLPFIDHPMNRLILRSGIFALAAMLAIHSARARDDGRYANSPLKSWFDHLASGRGLCCSFADGVVVEDPDWEVHTSTGAAAETNGIHYRVRIDGKWIDVPDDAVVTEPNRLGKTMVWPMTGLDGITVRCFLPGSMT